MVAVLWLQDPSDPAKVDIDLTFSNALDGLDGRPFGILALGINDLGEVTGNMRVSGIAHAFRYTPTASPRVQDLGFLYPANPDSRDGTSITTVRSRECPTSHGRRATGTADMEHPTRSATRMGTGWSTWAR